MTIMPTYGRLPVNFERGEGLYLYDDAGKRYTDALCGLAVVGLGTLARHRAEEAAR